MVKGESELGARPIIRAIENEYENKITDLLLSNDYQDSHVFNISKIKKNNVTVE